MAKKKGNDRQRQQRAQKRKARQQKRKASAGRTAPRVEVRGASVHDLAGLSVPHPERCLPPVHVDDRGKVVDDPRTVLGLPPGPLDEAQVRAAWRQALIAHPPEQDPEGARVAREARDRLVDPAQAIPRELGVLHVPDAKAWGLESTEIPVAERLDAESRLVGQAVLYAMFEDALWHQGLSERAANRRGWARR
jgi:hypothetical protein